VHYATAWRKAQQALERLDGATQPTLTIVDRSDPVRNGSQTTRYAVVTNVSDVRPWTLENISVDVNGNERATRRIQTAGVAPGENIPTTVGFNITSRVANLTVTVEERDTMDLSASDWDGADIESTVENSGQGPPDDTPGQGPPDNPGAGPPDDSDGTNEQATAVLQLDGDGLQDTYERNTLETDPLDPDSDAGVTPANEANNGIIDGNEDYDGDNLTTSEERRLGTDPLDEDTDGDNLTNRAELTLGQSDPLVADTDDDGTLDGAEDPDDDGLTNAEEIETGTLPFVADSDGDNLDDGEEMAIGTDPTDPDTDDDSLQDDEEGEIPFNTDPLNPDTDDDGTLDGNEIYTTTTSSDDLDVEVELTGPGNVAGGVTIANGTQPVYHTEAIDDSRVTDIVELNSDREFDQADITFEYDETTVPGNESNLDVYTYNQSLQTFVAVDTTVNPAEDTVTAQTSHFSRFVVFHTPTWADQFSSELPDTGRGNNATDPTEVPLDVTFVMDSSGSMSSNDPNGFRKIAAKEFVGALIEGDRAAVVDFDSSASVTQSLTTDRGAVNSSIDALDAYGGTNIGAGVSAANQHFSARSNDSRAQVMILLTDGQGSGGIAEAETAAEQNTTIYTIGFGGANDDKLENIASITGGSYNRVADADDLPEVFSRVAENTTSEIDTDEDGIPDSWEQQGIPTGYGPVYSNPDNADTDGDGLEDGEEVLVDDVVTREFESIDRSMTYVQLQSYPTITDSDDDNVSDNEEVTVTQIPYEEVPSGRSIPGTNNEAYRWDHDREIPDSAGDLPNTLDITSNPLEVDSDDDGLPDGVEYYQTKTDPRAERTYAITQEHQQLVNDLEDEGSGAQIAAREIGILSNGEQLNDLSLTDRTDDFDFVLDDNTDGSVGDKLDFRTFASPVGPAIQQTDTWFSNQAEVAHYEADSDQEAQQWLQRAEAQHLPAPAQEPETAYVWDPDTDDDGLTDGQEQRGWVLVGGNIGSAPLNTDPWDADTDGDGYWDGRIGVYDVGYTDNVILYAENLQDGDGVEGDEIVQEQVELHEVPDGSPGADIDGDDVQEHSKVHIGELSWETDPTDPNTDEIDVTVEADFVSGRPDENFNQGSWDTGVENNFALYGINVDIIRDDTVDSLLGRTIWGESTDYNLLVTGEPEDDIFGLDIDDIPGVRSPSDIWGYNAEASGVPEGPIVNFGGEGHYLYEENIYDFAVGQVGQTTYETSPYTSKTNFLGAFVEMHELGHSLSIGEADDSGYPLPIGEVYSGSGSDDTVEEINRIASDRWSIMRAGWDSRAVQYSSFRETTYFVFSIEELSTI